MAKYLREFETAVAGIPCRIGITAWEPHRPGRFSAAPEYCYPDDGGYGEWEVLDRNGRRAPWLERKLTANETDHIEEQVFELMENV